MDELLEKKLKIKSLFLRQFILYGWVALIPTVIDIGLLVFLTEFFNLYYLYSLIIAFVLSSVVSYVFQKKFTFQNGSKQYFNQCLSFALVSLGGLYLNLGIMLVLTEYFHLWYFFSKLVALFSIYFWNFVANRQLTFKLFQ